MFGQGVAANTALVKAIGYQIGSLDSGLDFGFLNGMVGITQYVVERVFEDFEGLASTMRVFVDFEQPE